MESIFSISSKSFGKVGEDIACEYLKEKGWKIIRRNWQNRFGEIDIIAFAPQDEGSSKQLVFIEVKSRRSTNAGFPEEAIDRVKFRKIAKMLSIWNGYFSKEEEVDERIDAISITFPKKLRVQLESVDKFDYKTLRPFIKIRHLRSAEIGEFY